MDALQSMQTYLSTRPKNFDSLEAGIRWHLQSRTVRKRESARVSVPPLLAQDAGQWNWRTDLAKTRPFWEGNPQLTDSGLTEDWFKGLSGKFLGSRAGKLLLLAGTDRLDKPLMIGQMQGILQTVFGQLRLTGVGKYQLMVFGDAGHFLHEDFPSRTADALVELWRRNDQEAIKRVALLNKQRHLAAS
jgi:protein phosphatase methylesterase 1